MLQGKQKTIKNGMVSKWVKGLMIVGLILGGFVGTGCSIGLDEEPPAAAPTLGVNKNNLTFRVPSFPTRPPRRTHSSRSWSYGNSCHARWRNCSTRAYRMNRACWGFYSRCRRSSLNPRACYGRKRACSARAEAFKKKCSADYAKCLVKERKKIICLRANYTCRAFGNDSKRCFDAQFLCDRYSGNTKNNLNAAICNFFAQNGKVAICRPTDNQGNHTVIQVDATKCGQGESGHKNDFISVDGTTCSANACYPENTPTDGKFACCTGLKNENGICVKDTCPATDCTATGTCLFDTYTGGSVNGAPITSNVQCLDSEFISNTAQGSVCYKVPANGNTGSCASRGSANVVDYLMPNFTPAEWSSLINFLGAGTTNSHITTELKTAVGGNYKVTFDVRRVEWGGPVASRHSLQATANDADGTVLATSASTTTPVNYTPVTVSFTFTAKSASTILSFKATLCTGPNCNANQDIGLDNLKVERLP